MRQEYLEFDYVIIGGGSAGCLIARRLVENGCGTVALLEYGGAGWWDQRIRIPAAFTQLYKTRRDYAYFSEPQDALNGRRLFLPRGKVLGGSGSINAMIYIRGHQAVYDNWAAMGCTGWAYEQLLPYFKKTEKNERYGEPYHGTQGIWNIADLLRPHYLSFRFLDAMASCGFAIRDDLNEPENEGAGLHQVNQINGERHSPALAFLKPVLENPLFNLFIRCKALKLKLNAQKNVVEGVWARKQGHEFFVGARREVVVCAGTFESPVLLMRSGIGAPDELEKCGIKPLVDLPAVGKNLQDHPFLPLTMGVTTQDTYDQAETVWNIIQWYVDRRHSLFTSNAAEASGFWRSSPSLPQPDIQFHFVPAHFVDHGFIRSRRPGVSLCAILIQPKSRGQVRLNPQNPEGPPLIDPRIFSEQEDLSVFAKGLLKASEILHSSPFLQIASGHNPLPNRFDSETDLINHIRNFTELLYHPTSTCAMGCDTRSSVVNPELQVHGVLNLRVADASVMPTITAGNTHAPTVMIAEKAADLIMGK
ncbi:MAG: GMC family oxidoreductase N-terminal domain-containing protein [Flavobacteriales bacterium]|nr:GMC family oxidoreductase N-terminal domain-containing protein [Flavobacteriales bacterium]MCX7768740.1 GMC family oxidoreductase N-terminal domain-containing protein [Flavobacteriales bacterium]MDW8409900.1 GMC family oxidoreductase N-terminal domain-containing protein [Flavobacteriales bacterium]